MKPLNAIKQAARMRQREAARTLQRTRAPAADTASTGARIAPRFHSRAWLLRGVSTLPATASSFFNRPESRFSGAVMMA